MGLLFAGVAWAQSPGVDPNLEAREGRAVPRSQQQPASLGEGVQSALQALDPPAQNWQGEAAAEAMTARIRGFAEAFLTRSNPQDLTAVDGSPWASPSASPSGSIRWYAGGAPPADGAWSHWRGDRLEAGTWQEAVQALQGRSEGPWRNLGFHIEEVLESSQERQAAKVRFHAASHGSRRTASLHSVWHFRWERSGDGPWLWSSSEELHAESLWVPSTVGQTFVDRSQDVIPKGLYAAQLVPGLPAWRDRLDAELGLGLLGHQGLAIADVNGDGLEDVYLCEPGGLPNRLLLRQPGGATLDASKALGVDLLDYTASALFVDLDQDGDRDLVVATGHGVVGFENRPGQAFRRVFDVPGTDCTSLAAADIEGDGDLDLYVCRYASPYESDGLPFPYHDAENGAANWMLVNQGGWVFEEQSAALGLEEGAHRFSFAAAFEDYDNDGDQDLYVANDFGRNALYRWDGESFQSVGGLTGADDLAAGMGVTWGDWNRDGHMDLYVSNMDSNAGQRVARMPAFLPGADAQARRQYLGHALGSSTYLGTPDGNFENFTMQSGARHSLWAWGGLSMDLDCDGNLDLVVPNGFVTGPQTRDL